MILSSYIPKHTQNKQLNIYKKKIEQNIFRYKFTFDDLLVFRNICRNSPQNSVLFYFQLEKLLNDNFAGG